MTRWTEGNLQRLSSHLFLGLPTFVLLIINLYLRATCGFLSTGHSHSFHMCFPSASSLSRYPLQICWFTLPIQPITIFHYLMDDYLWRLYPFTWSINNVHGDGACNLSIWCQKGICRNLNNRNLSKNLAMKVFKFVLNGYFVLILII